jgi:glycosyltransferase involved in cell wall biosynthesis
VNRKSSKRCIWVIAKYATALEQGFETRTLALARQWVRAGREVVILSSSANHFTPTKPQRTPRADSIFEGVKMVVLRTMSYRKTASVRRVLSWFHFEWRIFREDLSDLPRPDVIVVSSLSLFSVLNGIRMARRFQCPWVFEVRDIWPLTLTEEGGVNSSHLLVRLMAFIERLGYLRAALTVGTMPNLSPHASKVAGREVICACIPFGFDPTSTPPIDAPVPRAELTVSRDENTLLIGYAGSIGVSNALNHVVDAAIRLRSDSRFRFLFLGDGDLRESLMARTRDCPSVTWLGKVPRHEVHSVLRQCDLLYFAAHPSKVWESGMSLNKVSDYLLAAKPILASYSGHPSILDEAGCGEFLPAGDTEAIVEALSRYAAKSRHELAEMGEAGRRWFFENRTWGHLASKYLCLLDGLPSEAVE